jgi:hypothetical protein
MTFGISGVVTCISTVLAAGLVAGCASSAAVTRPTVPEAIEAPATATPVLRWFAKGTQNYTCTAKADGSGAAWKLTAPEAKLFASPDDGASQVGLHGAGPTWAATDGTRFVGNGAMAKKAASPNPSAIPWLLVPRQDGDTTGTLGGVTYAQRIETVGGQPPATGCDTTTVGATVKIPYSATYVFYRGA